MGELNVAKGSGHQDGVNVEPGACLCPAIAVPDTNLLPQRQLRSRDGKILFGTECNRLNCKARRQIQGKLPERLDWSGPDDTEHCTYEFVGTWTVDADNTASRRCNL